ncbi:MAG: GNAT family N-acetyltransferase [Roseibium sp.]|uniref:GNAT family N-acetyltransferase n=1 Tax=Roseibium sp. TaxID=1936156 RepID=UPI003D9C3D24
MEFETSQSAKWCRLQQMSPIDVHDLLKLRQDVFVIEQNSLYQDIDGKDPEALHLLVRDAASGSLVGTVRVTEDVSAEKARIGRVVIAPRARGTGLGRKLMLAGIEKVEQILPSGTIDLSAQAHLEGFYRSLGFETVSDEYLEDGIAHVDMTRRCGAGN